MKSNRTRFHLKGEFHQSLIGAYLGLSLAAAHAQTLKQFRSIDAIPDHGGIIEAVDGSGKVRTARIDYPESISESESGKEKPLPFLTLKPGETLRTTEESQATVTLGDFGNVRLAPNTEIQLPVVEKEGASLKLLRGNAFVNINRDRKEKDKEFRLKTPKVVVAVRGTKFQSKVVADGSEETGVYEGAVQVSRDTKDGGGVAVVRANTILELGSDGSAKQRQMMRVDRLPDDFWDEKLEWQSEPMRSLRSCLNWDFGAGSSGYGKPRGLDERKKMTTFSDPILGDGVQINPFEASNDCNFVVQSTIVGGGTKKLPIAAELLIQGSVDMALRYTFAGTTNSGTIDSAAGEEKDLAGWTRILIPLDEMHVLSPDGQGSIDLRFTAGIKGGTTHFLRVIPTRMLVRSEVE